MFGVFKIKHNCINDIEPGVYKNLMILREITVLLEDTNFIYGTRSSRIWIWILLRNSKIWKFWILDQICT